MLQRKNSRGPFQKALWLKIVIVCSSMLLMLADFTHLAHAGFSSFLFDFVTADVEYPEATGTGVGETRTVKGTGKQAVFQLGGARMLRDFPPLLDPAASPCQTLVFFPGFGLNTIGPNDFVYAIQVTYTGDDMDTLRVGRCREATITSAGYCSPSPSPSPSPAPPSSADTASKPLGIDFSFSPPVRTFQKTAMLFYTSPHPPNFVPTFIANTPISSQGKIPGTNPGPGEVQSPIYGPCQSIIGIVKESLCIDPNKKENLTDGKIVANGVPTFYRFTVTNKGLTPLTNVEIKDPVALPTPIAIPRIEPGDPPVVVKSDPPKKADTNGTFSNTATVGADYDIPIYINGTPSSSGQTVHFSANSNTVQFKVADTGLCAMPVKCDTICFRTPILCQIFFNRLPAGAILIGGVNNNNPINIQTNGTLIRNVLIPCPISNCTLTPLQYFNQQFVAAQLSLAAVGGASSPVGVNALWSNLSCYSTLANFQPVKLSNDVILTPNSMLKDLFEQARKAITENRTAENRANDMTKLAGLLKLLNSTCNKSTL